MTEKPIVDLLVPGPGGVPFLANRVFSSVSFEDFVLPNPGNRVAALSDLQFNRCSVSPGTCVIRRGARLSKVLFDCFECGDAMRVSSEVFLDRVTIRGRGAPKMLWVRPQTEPPEPIAVTDQPGVEWSLNISDYCGEVSITGLQTDKIILAPSRHVILRTDKFRSVDWQSLGIAPLSYWRLMAKKVTADGASEGVFSLPKEPSRHFDRSMVELQILRDAGLVS